MIECLMSVTCSNVVWQMIVKLDFCSYFATAQIRIPFLFSCWRWFYLALVCGCCVCLCEARWSRAIWYDDIKFVIDVRRFLRCSRSFVVGVCSMESIACLAKHLNAINGVFTRDTAHFTCAFLLYRSIASNEVLNSFDMQWRLQLGIKCPQCS